MPVLSMTDAASVEEPWLWGNGEYPPDENSVMRFRWSEARVKTIPSRTPLQASCGVGAEIGVCLSSRGISKSCSI